LIWPVSYWKPKSTWHFSNSQLLIFKLQLKAGKSCLVQHAKVQAIKHRTTTSFTPER